MLLNQRVPKEKAMIRINNIKISADKKVDDKLLLNKAAKILSVNGKSIKKLEIAKKSIDSRIKNNVLYVCAVDIEIENEEKILALNIKNKNISKTQKYTYEIPSINSNIRPVIVGFGPAGMFAGLFLAEAGLKPIIFERGKCVEERQKDVENFFNNGILDTSSNIQFGEGGAGTFSDGKLTTNIKDSRCRFVLQQLVRFGAPQEILYLSKPHIGTDNLIKTVKNIRKHIISLGGEVHFSSEVTDISVENSKICGLKLQTPCKEYFFETDNVIMALGHSARNTFEMLDKKPLFISPKPFAVGVRIEHLQTMINNEQYGKFAQYLPPADYKLAVHLKNNRSVYTFCMCPGGYVVAAASEKNMVATNGMSFFDRNGKNANSALLVGISPQDFNGNSPLSGMYFQRDLESRAFLAGGSNYNAPAQLTGDFLAGKSSTEFSSIKPTYRPNVKLSDISAVFPDYITESLKMGITEMGKKIKGFDCPESIMTAVESRSSSPIRINRETDFQAIGVKGLYPCGEGCGYAGGIVSAAVDGLRCAQALSSKLL